MRAHIVVPDELIAEVDAQVGQRKRSRFIAEAIEEKLRTNRVLDAFDQVAGFLVDADIPGWETPESRVEWVRNLRRESDRVDRLWGLTPDDGTRESSVDENEPA
jgi:hypothetical protein